MTPEQRRLVMRDAMAEVLLSIHSRLYLAGGPRPSPEAVWDAATQIANCTSREELADVMARLSEVGGVFTHPDDVRKEDTNG